MSDVVDGAVKESPEELSMSDVALDMNDVIPDDPSDQREGDEDATSETSKGRDDPFDAPVRGPAISADDDDDFEALIVDLDGFEGPLDVLLELARSQKVDLRKISMVALVDQYLQFIEIAKSKSLELAADYLVMASWLAYLKSKLLLPVLETEGDEPTADEMAARLAFQLQRLEAMRTASEKLMELPRLGQDFAVRGAPEGVRVLKTPEWHADLFDLLQAYARQRVANVERTYKPELPKVFSVEEARIRLARILGAIPEWVELGTLAVGNDIDAPRSSIVASAFNAALEFAKNGKIDLRQGSAFEPIYIRRRDDAKAENSQVLINQALINKDGDL